MRDLLFPLLKTSKSGVDDRGHCLRITHTRRRIRDLKQEDAARARGGQQEDFHSNGIEVDSI